jgi:PAS domain S-box-containing protein
MSVGPNLSLERHLLLLIHAPTGRDARILEDLYCRSGMAALVCVTVSDLCREMEGGAGAVVIAEEAFDLSTVKAIATTLRKQEAWSDLPLIVLTSGGDSSESGRLRLIELESLGDLTFLERPLRPQSLITAARSALRARARQYELRRRDAELQLVTDNVPVLIAYVDTNEVYRRANRTYFDWFGKHPEEVVGRRIRDIIGEDTYQRVKPYIDRAILGERVFFQTSMTDSRGAKREIAVTYSPDRNSQAGIQGVVILVQDITEQKRSEEILRRHAAEFEQIANSLPQLVWVTRPDGHHEWYNRRWYEYTGASFEKSSGTQWADFFHPEDVEECQRRWKHSLVTGEPYVVEYRCRRWDGIWRWFLGRAEPIRDDLGQITRWFGTCTDIEDQKTAEEALRRSNEDLERFAYMASHDLQEPLRMITTYSQLLARRHRGKLGGDADTYLQFVLDGTQRMGIIIRDLLVYAHSTGEESLQTTTVDCNSALQMALANLRGAIEELKPSLTWDSLPAVEGVEGLIAQVLQNLIGNALKYTRPEIPPEIHIGSRRVGNHWEICVRDNGQGIAPEHQQKVFRLFARLHDRSVSGTGIGLATCARIIERLGGRIWLESEPGVGSTFYFSLPSADSEVFRS